MAQNPQDSDLDPGDVGFPGQQTSGQGDQRNSVDLDGLVDALLKHPKLSAELSKATQSVKDQRFAKQGKQLGDFESRLERMETLMRDEGMSKSMALRTMRLEDLLDQSGAEAPRSPGAGSGGNRTEPSSSLDADAFLRAVNIDPNDPEVKQLYEGGITPDKLVNFVVGRGSKAAPKPSQAMPSGGGNVPRQDLMAQYKAEVLGKPNYEVLEIRRKYRALGLPL